ncbi:hypothetical protein ACFORL_11780 [Legionella dresdenensis]|uniref:Ankyrin repeats (3 copies) n=1 Tax=Legionella dresdenensis TaxID=450200 RepID=A0ABV8CHK0_9GAMM
MKLQEAIDKLNSLNQRSTSAIYISHHSIKNELNDVLNNYLPNAFEQNSPLFAQYEVLTDALKGKIQSLYESNQQMIKKLDFEETCTELINKNDVENLTGLINIGEYFGTGPHGKDVCTPLDNIYDFFRTNPQQRTSSNKAALDKLCDILKETRLAIPERNFKLFANPRERVKAILKANEISDLMVWLVSATQDDREFALRAAASVDTCKDCLLFLLSRTAPNCKEASINLLAQGQPSGQNALHRAIASGKTLIVSILLDDKLNPSNGLLKQLLARDSKGLTPIDLIKKMADKIDQSRVVDRITTALNNYQNNSRFGLTEANIQSLNQNLDQVKSLIETHNSYPGF